MTGKVVLITGGTSGIGKATAMALARRGATVVITARSSERGTQVVEEIRAVAGLDRAHWIHLDLASCMSIRRCATEFRDRFPRLDVLLNNAGVVLSARSETGDGFETTFGVNHLGHFLLTHLLLERLKQSAPARVVIVASTAHWLVPFGIDFDDLQSERRYDGMLAYARSKLANIHFTRELARRLAGTDVTANSLCPGLVASRFAGDGDTSGFLQMVSRLSRPLALSPEKGAATSVYLASSPAVQSVTGQHFVLGRPAPISWAAHDDRAARRLWEISDALVASACHERVPG